MAVCERSDPTLSLLTTPVPLILLLMMLLILLLLVVVAASLTDITAISHH